MRTGRTLRYLQLLEGEKIYSWMMPAGGGHVAAATENGKIVVWEAKSGKRVFSASKNYRRQCHAIVSPDGRYAMLSGEDSSARQVEGSHTSRFALWDIEKGEELATLLAHTGTYQDAVFTADSRYVAHTAQHFGVVIREVPNSPLGEGAQ